MSIGAHSLHRCLMFLLGFCLSKGSPPSPVTNLRSSRLTFPHALPTSYSSSPDSLPSAGFRDFTFSFWTFRAWEIKRGAVRNRKPFFEKSLPLFFNTFLARVLVFFRFFPWSVPAKRTATPRPFPARLIAILFPYSFLRMLF